MIPTKRYSGEFKLRSRKKKEPGTEAPSEYQIIFSGPSVRLILAGVKTQTRRVVGSPPDDNPLPGERRWVREKWTGWYHSGGLRIIYAADKSERIVDPPADYILPKAALNPGNWVSPIFMPRFASRITLEITKVRTQHIQEISETDALAEGVQPLDGNFNGCYEFHDCLSGSTARECFRRGWDALNKKRGYDWDQNPLVYALTFRVLGGKVNDA